MNIERFVAVAAADLYKPMGFNDAEKHAQGWIVLDKSKSSSAMIISWFWGPYAKTFAEDHVENIRRFIEHGADI